MIAALRARAADLLGSADFARVYTLVALCTALAGYAIRHLASPWTLNSMIAGLAAIGAAMLWVRRRELTLIGFAPTLLIGFVLWALITAAWAFDRWLSVTGWLEMVSYAFVAVAIAQVRDTMQIVRALGDAMRGLLGLSIALEVLVGILLDTSFPQLHLAGNIAFGGPIQGLFGSRNLLAFMAMIAIVTFFVEWRMRSVTGGLALASTALAGVAAVLTKSPTAFVLACVLAVTLVVLLLVRRVGPRRRLDVHRALAVVVIVLGVVAYLFRGVISDAINAATAFGNRAALWTEVLRWVERRTIQGWGWYGNWGGDPFPFRTIDFLLGKAHDSALNAYLDVFLQLGAVGLALFGGMAALSFARGWVMASERRSSVYMWLPLMLAVILVTSLAESFTLEGPGWLLLVLCVVKAGQARSWRTLILDRQDAPETLPQNGIGPDRGDDR